MQSDADKNRPNRGRVVCNGGSFMLGRDGKGLVPPMMFSSVNITRFGA